MASPKATPLGLKTLPPHSPHQAACHKDQSEEQESSIYSSADHDRQVHSESLRLAQDPDKRFCGKSRPGPAQGGPPGSGSLPTMRLVVPNAVLVQNAAF